MGADTFTTLASGKTAQEAFQSATEDAAYEHGHGGYTGTIAEKNSFVMIGVPYELSTTTPNASIQQLALEYADHLIEECDPRIDDKWGPAGCIDLMDGKFLFFGWASS